MMNLGLFVQNMMRAAQLTQPGGPENLYIGEVPTPVPGEGEVLIKVKATAINRADTLQVLISQSEMCTWFSVMMSVYVLFF